MHLCVIVHSCCCCWWWSHLVDSRECCCLLCHLLHPLAADQGRDITTQLACCCECVEGGCGHLAVAVLNNNQGADLVVVGWTGRGLTGGKGVNTGLGGAWEGGGGDGIVRLLEELQEVM